ncbi:MULTISPECIES: peptidoglycan -binding protein [unclassified Haematobacter]|uniref:peptidoglycan -binding protein n=1 Tax=unclassified Haematobacter TaxID=2640585 RepID=UPI0025C065E4|nr:MULTISPECIES: peptidoglycan -binding protein [unclassified Haematobacter]
MAFSRGRTRFETNVWPGFVDAMTSLLMVIMFVLSIFMIVMFVLQDRVSSQDSELEALTGEVAQLSRALNISERRGQVLEGTLAERQGALDAATGRITDFEAQVAALIAARDRAQTSLATAEGEKRELLSAQEALNLALAQARQEVDAGQEAARLAAARREALEALVADLRAKGEADAARLSEAEVQRLTESEAAAALRERLKNADAELTAMTLALEEQRKRAEETLTLLAAAEAARDTAKADATRELTEAERRAGLLAAANSALAGQQARGAEDARRVAALNEQVAALRAQLGSLQAVLDASGEKTREADVRIETLGGQLNVALAQVAEEQRRRAELEAAERARLAAEAERLERYSSEFFGKLRDVLQGRDGVRIVGDRFVFSSEVLFQPGSDTLAPEGRSQIAGVASILKDISNEIPPGIDWILRVDGHTDDTPLSGTGQFRDNWELSQARALSVVRYMVNDLGFPPERLAATGFGEFRPVASGNSPEARAQNRRIELKLTER